MEEDQKFDEKSYKFTMMNNKEIQLKFWNKNFNFSRVWFKKLGTSLNILILLKNFIMIKLLSIEKILSRREHFLNKTLTRLEIAMIAWINKKFFGVVDWENFRLYK